MDGFLQRFLAEEYKIPTMRPVPDRSVIDNIIKTHPNGAPVFRANAVKKNKLRADLKYRASLAKQKITKEALASPKIPNIGDEDDCMVYLRKCADKIITVPFLNSWKDDIMKRIDKRLTTSYPKLVEANFNEVRRIWYDTVHELSVKSMVREYPGAERKIYVEKEFKFKGKTEYFEEYLRIKAVMKGKVTRVISNPFVRLIHESAYTLFPNYLIDMAKHRTDEDMTLSDLEKRANEDIQAANATLSKKWYTSILSKWLMNTKYFNGLKVKDKLRFLKYIPKLINFKVSECIRATVLNIIDCVDHSDIPKIAFNVTFHPSTGFNLDPSVNDVIELYEQIIHKITNGIAQNLPNIEHFLNVPTDLDSFSVVFNVDIFRECITHLRDSLKKAFEPISNYVEGLNSKFVDLYGPAADESFETYKAGIGDFYKSREMIYFLQDNKAELLHVHQSEFFDVGTITKTNMIDSLRERASEFIDAILHGICLQHQAENNSICATFENISQKLTDPLTTSIELVEREAFCTYVKSVLMEELKERVTNSMLVLSKLLELTPISESHVELNNRTVKWLKDIIPILDEGGYQYEEAKAIVDLNLKASVTKFNMTLAGIFPLLVTLDNMNDINRTFEYLSDLRKLYKQVKNCEEQLEWINNEEKTLKYPISEFPNLGELKQYIFPFYNLVYYVHKWRRSYYVWIDGAIDDLDRIVVEQQHEEYYKEFLRLNRVYKTALRQQQIEKKEHRFKGNPDEPKIENMPSPLSLCKQAVQEIKDFRPIVRLCNIMCNPALYQRHWDDMSANAGVDLTPDAGSTLRKFAHLNLWDKMDEYEIISIGATKELALITSLKQMMSEWQDVCFKTSLYKESGIQILSALDDIQMLLDDHILKTIGMRGSAFVKPFAEEVKSWYETLLRINSSIEEWGKVQAQWLYLLPIFSSKDIVMQMPAEGALFVDVDGTYKRYMGSLKNEPRVLQSAGAVGLLEAMIEANSHLETINEGVTNYLERKRLYFPRFFFLSNDEMLEILSETKDPLRVQPHLKKCFEGINKLVFDADLNISSMVSAEGEVVDFLGSVSTVKARGSVEIWLHQVEKEMISAVRSEIEQSYFDFPLIEREEWAQNWEGMVVLCVSQIYWAIDITNCLEMHSLKQLINYRDFLTEQLKKLVQLVRNPNLTSLTNITLKALIVIDVHAKDVVEELIDKTVIEVTDFNWLAQLRYYWEINNVSVKIVNASVDFAYEYLGNTDRLVITPLTDRCYRTLVGAFILHLNGAPEGPAGTGKTETTKDLAKALAVQCIVFNCSDGLDYIAMGKFFKGIASSGAWACFDEFNRIDVEVLSVIAQQILCIIQAVRRDAVNFIFEGTELTLNKRCYVSITMNPGYAGRSELPDNLKVLFRPVAMMVPDYAMIGEISLYSFGFVDARKLSIKIITTYKLCSEQLSSQNHYDYGMRAVKTVLQAAGNNKRSFPNEDESVLLLRSIIDVNLAKFLSFDIPLFEGIISDLFPGITLPKPDYDHFLDAARVVCRESNLQATETVLLKVIQTYEMMIVRHGFMLVGNSFSGKSSTLYILSKALTLLNSKGLDYVAAQYCVVNPKAVTLNHLYGAFDPVSYEWTDGIIPYIFREYAMDESPDRKWVVFDGPVDAVWIESMNTVLDDNKKLCLISGEVISMSHSMSMVFEVMDLSQASPATVSRCGMIYMESSSLGYRPFCISWINTCNIEWINGNEELLLDLCDLFLAKTLQFVRKECLQLASGGEINLVICTLRLTQMLMDDAIDTEPNTVETVRWIQASFIFGIIWGVGGILDSESRNKFDDFVRNIVTDDTNEINLFLPESYIYENCYVYKSKGYWRSWAEIAKQLNVIEEKSLQQTYIPTAESVKYTFLLDFHIKNKYPFLIIGPTGTGKTFYVQNFLMTNLSMEKYEPAFVTFTTTTTAKQTQELVISKLYRRKRGVYGPSKGTFAVIFIDDLNMPIKEEYGAQPAIELLRLYLDQTFWYDLKSTSKLFLVDLMFIGAMGVPGGSRQFITERLLSHFSMFSINSFSSESIIKIFTNILQIGMTRKEIRSEFIQLAPRMVAATMDFYSSVSLELRPTPHKSHYIFNLRDFARVMQGCSLIKGESIVHKYTIVRLWIHEIVRVFYDRLVDEDDRQIVFQLIQRCLKEHFRESTEMVMENYRNKNGMISKECLTYLMFGTYLDTDNEGDNKNYDELQTLGQLFDAATAVLEEYNSTHKSKLSVVLFDYALVHLSKICRLLLMPSSSGLLVGVGGSGKQSLTKLSAAMCGANLYQPEITQMYSTRSWHDDIKIVLKEAGGLAKHTAFLFSEGQIKYETFLQNLDSLLNSGEVPNLFGVDERQEILEMVRLDAQGGNRNLDVSPLRVFSFFVGRCKEKLHLILCFSPTGSAFRSRLYVYPSFVNCCTIDWFDSWPEEALEKVARFYMETVLLSDQVKTCAVNILKRFHVDALSLSTQFFEEFRRKTYITSASYLDLIRSFNSLTIKKQTEIKEAHFRYTNGLDKLRMAAEAVAIMQAELEELKPRLIVTAEKSVKMALEIETETVEADRAAAQVKDDEKVANVQAAAAQELKSECEADLALALPILEEAINALNTLKPADIGLVKSMKNPPAAIKLVMAAICVMLNVKPAKVPDPNNTGKKMLDFWGPSQRLLGDINFLVNLKEFDKDNISTEIMQKIRKEYLFNPSFKPHIIKKASTAAEGLCKWIIAIDMYDEVAKVVGPKKAKLKSAEQELAQTERILNEKVMLVEALELKVLNLKLALDEANRNKRELEMSVELCVDKLTRAEKLIGGLGGERTRWTDVANALQASYDSLAGDLLLSSGIIAYLAPFTMPFRTKVIKDWQNFITNQGILMSTNYIFRIVLGSDLKIHNWYVNGLPRDVFSTDNAIIQNNSIRWSLLIDPQGQANDWIKSMEKSNDLQIMTFATGNYMKILETCLEHGKPALIESVQEDLETPLDPILYRNTFKQDNRDFLAIGDNVFEYNPRFRLYMTTKLRNPHYLPEVFNKVTIINFALTLEGLQDQLLGIVVTKERADLQAKKETLVIQSAENKTALQNLENKILQTLQHTEGDILEDENAIQILDSSKLLAVDVTKKQVVIHQTEEAIENFRLGYKPIATYSGVLYYCVTELPSIDPMYQYSLTWFINLYIYSIETANKSNDLQKRLNSLREAFTYNLYSNVCRSLFEKDKTMFSFIVCTKLQMASNEIDYAELMFLLSGGTTGDNSTANAIEWLTERSWDEACRLSAFGAFNNFNVSLQKNDSQWKVIYDSMQPHRLTFPLPWQTNLTDFQKLLVWRIIRPDKLREAIKLYVEKSMGVKFVTPPPFDIAKSFANSDCLTPLIFLLSPGADPMAVLSKFCEKMGYSTKFMSISLGQGQGPIAQAMLSQAQTEGCWICMQNCHLCMSWMPTLEKLVSSFDLTNTDLSFRLWLTSYPSEKFPQTILQNGIKMTNEPPTGLRRSLLRSYTSEPVKDPQFYEGCPSKEKAFVRLMYALSFFHALVQERRNFGPLGWNIQYGFNETDFQISITQLQMFLNQYDEIQFTAIKYLIGECNYGGRVTDAWDRRLIVTILQDFMNADIVSDLKYAFYPSYGLPKRYGYGDYLNHIESVPLNPPPDVYGLHMNAGIVRDHASSMSLLYSLLLVEGGGSKIEGSDNDDILINISTDIISKIPKPFIIDKVSEKYPVDYNESMNTVLVQEMQRFNKLTTVILKSADDIIKAVKGQIVMSQTLQLIISAILIGKIPGEWLKVSYPSLKPFSSYLADLCDRLVVFQNWFDKGKPGSFWLSGFFFTQAFLTGGMQNYARFHKIPIDLLTFDNKVLNTIYETEPPADGMFVYGLFIDGARWDRTTKNIAEQYPKILNDALPLIWLKPIESIIFSEGSRYKCPLYKTLERKGVLATTGHSSNYVLPIMLPSDKPVSHWIKRSVAAILQLSD